MAECSQGQWVRSTSAKTKVLD